MAARERDNILDRQRCGLPELDIDDWSSDAKLFAHKKELERDYASDQRMRLFVNVHNVWRNACRSLLRKIRLLDCDILGSCQTEGPTERPGMAKRSSKPLVSLIEDSCCRRLRRAWEVRSQSCNARFFDDGSMLSKCDNCAEARKDCVSVGLQSRLTWHSHTSSALTNLSGPQTQRTPRDGKPIDDPAPALREVGATRLG